jgi:thioesterase domain-containing protein
MQARIIAQLAKAYQTRRARWADQLQRDLGRLDPARSAVLAQLLTTARSRLAPLAALARSPLLATDLRTEIGSDLARTVEKLQQELERVARQDPAVERVMLHTVRQYPLALGLTTEAVTAYVSSMTAAPGSGRRVLI